VRRRAQRAIRVVNLDIRPSRTQSPSTRPTTCTSTRTDTHKRHFATCEESLLGLIRCLHLLWRLPHASPARDTASALAQDESHYAQRQRQNDQGNRSLSDTKRFTNATGAHVRRSRSSSRRPRHGLPPKVIRSTVFRFSPARDDSRSRIASCSGLPSSRWRIRRRRICAEPPNVLLPDGAPRAPLDAQTRLASANA
jgi:hypothetical protein